ncbi:Polycomb group protein EMBRYONIC FLOWER 2 [Platanthera guangdongensis]|uniref:Polycomb group protein EMBRYONIC FLOWER 2 n=1 Tax=Platanthera guangdongensis TaxID=2320717 RepID=A0ABR2MQW2_9ASPA
MPGWPLVDHETATLGCSCNHSRSTAQMCRQQSRLCLTAEEELAAEESLSIYCKPVEFYNILQRRALRKRCLQYKIQAKNKRRATTKFLELRWKLQTHIVHELRTRIELYEVESPVVPQ